MHSIRQARALLRRVWLPVIFGALASAALVGGVARAASDSVSMWDAAEFRSWSFVPYWTSQSQLNSFLGDRVYDHVSDVLYFSGVRPTSDGGLNYHTAAAQHLATLKSHASQAGFDLHMSMFDVAPGSNVDAVWRSIISNPRHRANFVNNVRNLLETYDMKGFNFDWERPSSVSEWADYTQLAKDLRAAIEPLGMEVSVDDYGGTDTRWDATPTFDARTYDQLFIMGYHYPAYHPNPNPWNNNNSFADSKLALTEQGAEKAFKNEQLVLGIGTWGVKVGGGSLKTMKDIAAANPNLPFNAGTYSDSSGTWTIESRQQVREKVQLALDRNMAGVMFWTLHYDATDKLSLHRVAHHYTAVARAIPDLNLDGRVDQLDAHAMADNLGSVTIRNGTNTAARFDSFYMNGNWEAGDHDGNGFVNQRDADWLAERFTALGVNLPDRLAYSGTFENFGDSAGLTGRWRVARDEENNLTETGNFTQHGAGYLAFSATGPGGRLHSSTALTLRNQNSAEGAGSMNGAPRVAEVDLAAPIDLSHGEDVYFTLLVRQNTDSLIGAQPTSPERILALKFLDNTGESQFDFSFHGFEQEFSIASQRDDGLAGATSGGFGSDETYLLVGKIAPASEGPYSLHASLFGEGAEVDNFTLPAFEWMLSAEGSAEFDATITQLRLQSESEANYTVSNLWLGAPAMFFEPLASAWGDFNDDGVVDAADYTVWRDTLGQSVATGSGADGNGDGTIGASDYAIWKTNFGQVLGDPSAASAGAVPEPGTLALVMLACSSAIMRLRRRATLIHS